jgi:hypothetical protein
VVVVVDATWNPPPPKKETIVSIQILNHEKVETYTKIDLLKKRRKCCISSSQLSRIEGVPRGREGEMRRSKSRARARSRGKQGWKHLVKEKKFRKITFKT